MRKVEVELASLDQQLNQLVGLVVVALQVERAQLRNEELQVLANRCSKIGVDATRGKSLDCVRLVGVKFDQERYRVGVLDIGAASKELPLGEASDEVGLGG